VPRFGGRSHQNHQPVIPGAVTLLIVFIRPDLESLHSGHLAKPSERPPYLGVEAERSHGWRWNCRVKATICLKTQNPISVEHSPPIIKLEGRSKPWLPEISQELGTGQSRVPFDPSREAGLRSLTAANPFTRDLCQRGAPRRFGYDITLEMTVSRQTPLIQFSSVLRSVRQQSSSCSPLKRFPRGR